MQAFEFFNQPENSKVQEQFAEYFFLKDFIEEAANENYKVSVSRADYDSFGFDLLLERYHRGKWQSVRVQMKARSGKKSGGWDVHRSLLTSADGRIVLVRLHQSGGKVIPKYKVFDKSFCDIALARQPKKENALKCRVRESQFKTMGKLLHIFNRSSRTVR